MDGTCRTASARCSWIAAVLSTHVFLGGLCARGRGAGCSGGGDGPHPDLGIDTEPGLRPALAQASSRGLTGLAEATGRCKGPLLLGLRGLAGCVGLVCSWQQKAGCYGGGLFDDPLVFMPRAYRCSYKPSLCCSFFGATKMSACTAPLYGWEVIAELSATLVRLSGAANLWDA